VEVARIPELGDPVALVREELGHPADVIGVGMGRYGQGDGSVGTSVSWVGGGDEAHLEQGFDEGFGHVLLGGIDDHQTSRRRRLVGVSRFLGEEEHLLVTIADVQQEEDEMMRAD
jgi:hypothetical protein